jgi:AmpE protein
MEFLTILITLALLQLWGSGGPIQRDEWLQSVIESVVTWTDSSGLRLFAIIIGPCILLLLFLWLVDTMLFGLFSFIVYLGVLLYSLGRGEFNETIQRYLNAWGSGNFAEAKKYALNLGETLKSESEFEPGADIYVSPNVSASADAGSTSSDHVEQSKGDDSRLHGESYQSVHECVRTAILYEGFERWFAVIFWFLALGPIGALAYRLSQNCARSEILCEEDSQLALRVVHYLDWIPARLLALAFALTGNFVSSFEFYWQSLWEDNSVADVIEKSALAAITFTTGKKEDTDDEESFRISGRQEISALQALLSRSAVCWVAIIALFELFF